MKTTITKIFSENSQYQQIEALQHNRTKRHQANAFVVEGVRSINTAMRNSWKIEALAYCREKRLTDWAEGVIAQAEAREHFVLVAPLMKKLSQKEDTSELIAIVTMPPDDLKRIPVHESLLVVILDRPTNPGNLGSILRSCDALGADGMIITGHAVDLFDPETIRATTGSFFNVPAIRQPSLKEILPWLDGLKQQVHIQVVGTSAKATTPLQAFNFKPATLLLIGNERRGLSDAATALCDTMVTIPMYGSATSLNVACATSILLYEIDRQRKAG